MGRRTKIAIVCTGLGRVNRGFETLSRELFNHLRDDSLLDAHLFKGGGEYVGQEWAIPNIHRSSSVNRAICALVGTEKRFVIEYLSFCVSLAAAIAIKRPAVIYALEAPIYKFLLRWRKLTRSRYGVILTTGGQLGEVPVGQGAFVHHVTPFFLPLAARLGFENAQQFVIPQFIDLRAVPPISTQQQKTEIRARLQIPVDKKVVISVGSLDHSVKRMDYVIREVARLDERPYLILLGQTDTETTEISALARELLEPNTYRIASVPRQEVWDYYRAADVFTLASLMEGFGFVYVEALASGLPVVAHDFPIARWVLGEHGEFANLERDGALTEVLSHLLAQQVPAKAQTERRAFVQGRYDWSVLRDDYVRMFEAAADSTTS